MGASLPRPWNSHDDPSRLTLDPVGWKDPAFAVALHREVLRVGPRALRCAGKRLEFDYRFSINVVGWHGPTLRLLGDEAWLLPSLRIVTPPGEAPAPSDQEQMSFGIPRHFSKKSLWVGDYVVAHYSFGPQDAGVDAAPDIIEKYRALAGCPPDPAAVCE